MSLQVKSIRRRRKALPGVTTRHAKLSRPINDCNSLNVTVFRREKASKDDLSFSNFSCGNLASIVVESISLP